MALPSVATAGSFASRFNSPPVAGVTLSGDAAYVGGHVQLTAAANGQSGQMLLNDLDPGESIDAFSAHCQVFIGGGSGADGMSFSFGDPSSITSAVDGVNTGLAVSLDTFNNGGGDVFNAVQVRYNGASIATSGALTLRTGSYVNLDVVVRQDGLITVFHNTTFAISATIPGWSGVAGRRFVFNAATGGLNDEHSIEDVVIATTSAADFRSTFDSPPVSGVNLFGNAIYDAGAVKLTTTSPGGQQGAMILNDLDAGAAIQRFAATVRFGIGAGSGADGMSFAFGDLPSASFGEEGTGNGLILRFDTFGGGGDFVNEIEVVYAGAHVAASGVRTIRTGDFRDVVITMSANGRLAVAHQNSTNSSVPLIEVTIPGWAPQAGWRFGIGGRTGGLTDNHWVEDLAIETIACGNGALEDGEACDAGAANGTATSCCSSTCTFVTAGTQCRASAGVCDPAETCTGSSAACPTNSFATSGSSCTDDGNVCTDDQCNGSGACIHPNNTASCDDGLFCTGADTCSGGSCSAHAGDPCVGGPECANTCDEILNTCNLPAGTACTADSSVCSLDLCDGSGACTHPAGNAGATCRASAGDCDLPESCDGASPSCPTDLFRPSSYECRPPAGECDTAERCSGAAADCPANGFVAAGIACTDDGQPCTSDACDGDGTCEHVALPDTDVDSVCDAQDTCTNVGNARDFYARSKLVLTKINTDTTPGNDGLKLSAAFDLPSASSFGSLNPIAHGARIVLLNQAGGVEVDQVLPGGTYAGSGSRGWKSNTKGTVWQYLDKTTSPLSGITTLKVTDKNKTSPGRVTASLTGKKTTFPVVSADTPVQLVVVLGNQTDAIAGYCGESDFTPASCLFNGAQSTLVCRQ
ncbi:MAG: hypothetical protein FJ148_12145 [Deltaproteobacteria bacterium]|nr:hypothetical protein [Deltaproteobacteria bacterium]